MSSSTPGVPSCSARVNGPSGPCRPGSGTTLTQLCRSSSINGDNSGNWIPPSSRATCAMAAIPERSIPAGRLMLLCAKAKNARSAHASACRALISVTMKVLPTSRSSPKPGGITTVLVLRIRFPFSAEKLPGLSSSGAPGQARWQGAGRKRPGSPAARRYSALTA